MYGSGANLPHNIAPPFLSNYPEFPDSSLGDKLTFLVDILQVLFDCPDVLLEQFRDPKIKKP
jgi:hypothetical protein